MHQEKAEMENEILMLQKQLREYRQNRAKEMNATMVQAQYQFHAAKQDFELR